MSNLPEESGPRDAFAPIVVDAEGNAYTDLTREKESVIKSERLDPIHPVVQIDLESIITEDYGSAIAIAIQDFGLPPRIIRIGGDFTTMSDITGTRREDDHYTGAPRTLFLAAHSPDEKGTYRFDEKGLPEKETSRIELSRGESMIWAHNGDPSEERTGYIRENFWELTALSPKDYFGSPDFSDIIGLPGGFTALIGITYESNVLSIYSLDGAHADVLCQQVRSLSDDIKHYAGEEGVIDEIDPADVIAMLRVGDDSTGELLTRILSERTEAMMAVGGLRTQIIDAKIGNDNLETLLAVNKKMLRKARQEAADLAREVQRLQREGQTSGQTRQNRDSIFDFLGGRQTTEADPHGHCATIGIDSAFIFSLPSDAAKKVVNGVRKGLAAGFHSDTHDIDDEAMKRVNAAVDSILERLDQGYWGRR